MLLSTGEQISIALFAMAMEKCGLPVVSLTAWQVGIQTNNTYTDARIRKISKERIQAELDKRNIIIVAGFQGINSFGDVTTLGRSGSKDISFTCPLSSLDDARRVLEENKDALEYDSIEVDDNVAKISLVGAGMMTHVGVASDMFEALYDAGINIQMIATSEIRISVLVNKDDANRAIKVVHDKFFGNED